jgi:hypothetical protein
MSTIAAVRNGSGLDFNRYVHKVFKDLDSAHTWENRQPKNWTIRVFDAKLRTGDVVPPNTESRVI